MIEKERILAEIERQMKWKPKAIPSGMRQRDVINIRKTVLLTLKDFINSLPSEQPSEDLEEAANIYANKQGLELKPFAIKFFKSGANWQKQKLLDSAVNGITDCDDSNEWVEITDRFVITPSKAGKEVKVIIMDKQ